MIGQEWENCLNEYMILISFGFKHLSEKGYNFNWEKRVKRWGNYVAYILKAKKLVSSALCKSGGQKCISGKNRDLILEFMFCIVSSDNRNDTVNSSYSDATVWIQSDYCDFVSKGCLRTHSDKM